MSGYRKNNGALSVGILALAFIATPTYFLAWWILLTQAFYFQSWPALGLAVTVYAINRILVSFIKLLGKDLE